MAGHQWRRLRRPGRHHRQAGLPVLARRGRHLAVADDAVARRRLGLRRHRLPRRPPGAWHPGRPGPADRRGRPAGPAGAARPGAQPHQHRAPLVRRGARRPRQRRTGTTTCGPTRRPTAGRRTTGWPRPAHRPGPWTTGQRPVLPAQLPAQPAGPELVGTRRSTRSSGRSCGSGSTAGVAGFRIDVAHGLYKDAELRDNPPAAGEQPADRPVRPGPGVQRQPAGVATGCSGTGARSPRAIPAPRLLLGETWVGDLAALAAYYGHGR